MGAIIRGRRLFEGRLLFEEIRYIKNYFPPGGGAIDVTSPLSSMECSREFYASLLPLLLSMLVFFA